MVLVLPCEQNKLDMAINDKFSFLPDSSPDLLDEKNRRGYIFCDVVNCLLLLVCTFLGNVGIQGC